MKCTVIKNNKHYKLLYKGVQLKRATSVISETIEFT